MKKILLLLLFLIPFFSNAQLTCNAGNDQTITLPTNQVSLSGTASGGTSPYRYNWQKISGGKIGRITSPNSQTTNVTGLVQSVYKFKLTVTDNHHPTRHAFDTVQITVNNSGGGCTYPNTPRVLTITPTASGEIYRPNVSGWRAGDTLLIPAGTYTVNEFVGLVGSRCQYITIMPNGIVHLNGRLNFTLLDSFITMDGYIYGTNTVGMFVNGVVGCTESSYMTFKHLNITNPAGVGMLFKENPDTTRPITYYPNYTMNKISILYNTIKNTGGEGMYIGHTDPDGIDFVRPPTNMDSVEIAYNTTDSTGWDGIQLSNGQNGCSIHNNTVTHFGLQNLGSQQAGIIFGGNCSGSLDSNIVRNGTGNGLQMFGFGTLNCYKNEVDSAGNDGTTNGEQTIFSNQYNLTVYPATHNQQINIYNNSLLSLQKIIVVRVQNDGGNASAATATGNNICAKNLTQTAIVLDPPGSSQSGNAINTNCP